MRGVRNEEQKREAIRLRVEERASIGEIVARTGVSKGTLSAWLNPYPLTDEERHTRLAQARARIPSRRKDRGEESAYREMVRGRELTREHKGQIAEAAVLFRLTLHGLHVMAPVFDGGRTDWLVQVPSGALAKVQVKWAREGAGVGYGLPTLSLECFDGHSSRRRYHRNEFDFLVGYRLYTDTAYVFSHEETTKNATTVTIRDDAAEAWCKLLDFKGP